ncbi:MAG TPA: hypothetical protein DEA22_05250 [Blastocatellia bacterium]|nr:hypothetical protein [Blastocatellia bacterium]
MKRIKFPFLIVLLSIQLACQSSAQLQTQEKSERKPFRKSDYVINQKIKYTVEEMENGKIHNAKPKIVLIDQKAGKYEFRWIGYDGKKKVVAYQRHDAIDAVVAADVIKQDDRSYLFTYRINILPTSPIYYRDFIVQTFASDTTSIQPENKTILIGEMTNSISFFKEGVWRTFGFIGDETERLWGGNSIKFQLTSRSQPGIVNCKAVGGEIATMGVGEDVPRELDDEIPIFEDYANGYTIGPVDNLSGMDKAARAKYLLDNIPKFLKAGWMSEGTAKIYERLLRKEDLAGAFEQAKRDLKDEYITSEVFHIIEGLAQ